MIAAFAAGLLLPIAAGAHHATTKFDQHTRLELTGTVVSFDWGYPHIIIALRSPGTEGGRRVWQIEAAPPGRLERSGWSPTSFVAGQAVSIQVFPAHDGEAEGLFAGARFADGPTLGRYQWQSER